MVELGVESLGKPHGHRRRTHAGRTQRWPTRTAGLSGRLNEFVDHGVGKASSGAGTYILGFKVNVGPDGRVHSDLVHTPTMTYTTRVMQDTTQDDGDYHADEVA